MGRVWRSYGKGLPPGLRRQGKLETTRGAAWRQSDRKCSHAACKIQEQEIEEKGVREAGKEVVKKADKEYVLWRGGALTSETT